MASIELKEEKRIRETCAAKCFLDGYAFAEGCRTYRKFVIQEVMKKSAIRG